MANILLVYDKDTPGGTAGDQNVQTILQNAGHTVTMLPEDDAGHPFTSYDAVVITESGSSSSVDPYDPAAVPLVTMEYDWSRVRMGGAGTDAGGLSDIDLVSAHEINTGFADPLTIMASGTSWAPDATTVPSGATVIALNSANTARAFAAVADAGATLTTGTAPARRAVFGAVADSTANLNTDGAAYLVAIVEWAAGVGGGGGGGPFDVAVGQAVEIDTARPVTPAGQLPGPIDGIEPETHSRMGVVQDSNGNLYRITEDSYDPPTFHFNQPRMMKSTDGGVTWVEQDAAGRPGGYYDGIADLESAHVTWDAATALLTLTWQRGNVEIAQFRTSDNGTPDTWVNGDIDHVVSGVTPSTPQYASHTKPTDQTYLWVFWGDGTSGAVDYCTRAGQTGASGSVLTLDASGAYPSAVLLPDGSTTAVIYEKTSQVHYRELTSGGTLDASSTRVDTSGTSDSPDHLVPYAAPVAYASGGSTVVSVLFADVNEAVKCVDIVDGVPGAEQTVTASTVAANEGTTTSEQAIMSLAVDGDTLHALWVDASTWDVMHASRPFGGSWTTPTVLLDVSTTAFTEVAWVTAAVVNHGSGNLLGYTYDLAPHADNASNIRYDELALGGGGPLNVAVGQAVEVDTARPVAATITHRYVTVGQAGEVDTARPVVAAKARPVGQAVETDTAQSVTGAKARPVGQAVETDTAQSVTGAKARPVGQAVENDTARPVSTAAVKNVLVGQAVEVDAARPVAATITHRYVTVGQAVEIDTARPVSASAVKNVPVGQAVEVDAARPVAATITHRYVTVRQAVETEFALPVRTTDAVDVTFEPTPSRVGSVGVSTARFGVDVASSRIGNSAGPSRLDREA